MATTLYVRSSGTGQIWHIVRHPPRREDPVWDQRPALCGATGTRSQWNGLNGWYEQEFGRHGSPYGGVCPHCLALVAS